MKKAGLFLGACLLGFLLARLHIPIPYMLGGIVSSVIVKFFLDPGIAWPVTWRNWMLGVAGYGIGRNCTMETARQLMEQSVSVVFASVFTILVAVLIAVYICRSTYSNLLTCILGSMPGGMAQMLLLTEEDPRADANAVVVSQSIRFFGVVASVPFLAIKLFDAKSIEQVHRISEAWTWGWLYLIPITFAGSRIANRLKMPAGYLLGPIIVSALVSCLWKPMDAVPGAVMAFAQIHIGLYIGLMLDREKLIKTRKLIPYFCAGTTVMIIASILFAEFLSGHYHFSVITAFLAMAPGGIAEMCLAGLSMGEDVSLILTYQFARVLLLNFSVPFFVKWFFKADAYK